MAKGDVGKFIGGFGETFLKTLQSERDRKDKEKEFNQKMAFDNRQLNLLNAYRMGSLEQGQQRLDLNREKTEYDIRSGYEDVPSTLPFGIHPTTLGAKGGEDLNKPFGNIMNPFEPDKFYKERQGEGKAPTSPYSNEYTANVDGKPIRMGFNKNTQQFEKIGEQYYKDNVTNINMTMPKQEKWSKVGDWASKINQTQYWDDSKGEFVEVPEGYKDEMRRQATEQLKATMTPKAYAFFNKHLHTGKYSDEYYLKRIKKGLTDDEIDLDDAQDLIDLNNYREPIFGKKD